MFLLSSMPVGGAETLLANLVRRLDRRRIVPEICCLKERGKLGEELAREIPVHYGMIHSKYDVRVLRELRRLFQERQTDVVVTVGCGDKMFWGRLGARLAHVPVVISALHSTGWPDRVGWLNRQLSFLTDAFVAVGPSHAQYLAEEEGFPRDKIVVIPNGIDLDRFRPDATARHETRARLAISSTTRVCTMVAALRPEKNFPRLLRIAASVCQKLPDVRFLIVGDGPERSRLKALAYQLELQDHVRFLGCRQDVHQVLAASDLFLLTSDNEAKPVSILEALACELPVVASQVGSIHELVEPRVHGDLVPPGDEEGFVRSVVELLHDPNRRAAMGRAGRRHAESNGSLRHMIDGYVSHMERLYQRHARTQPAGGRGWSRFLPISWPQASLDPLAARPPADDDRIPGSRR